jgi:hypothetical protein
LKGTSHLKDTQRTGDTSLVSREAGVALPARVLHAGLSVETWSAQLGEIPLGNAKRVVTTRGAWHVMATTAEPQGSRRLSTWPERTDAHVGVQKDGSWLPYSY